MTSAANELSRWQALALQAVLPILLIGIVVPIGLIALVLALDGGGASKSVDNGELFLAGGNTAFTSCLILISMRPDKAINVCIVSLFLTCVVILPCYLSWALISTASVRGAEYPVEVTVHWGLVATAAGLVVAVPAVIYAFFWPSGKMAAATTAESATLGG